ncbi:hypothetical protein GW17_00052719 [Ensete ventricosum]|nr:hypothetical protein GW17_00052719 [Ensete ventricosum]
MKALTEKAKESTEAEEVQERSYSVRELCEVDGRARVDRYFATHMSKLPQAEGDEPLTPWWSSLSGSNCQVFHFASVLIDRAHDAGRMVHVQHERITVLRATNKELKFWAAPEAVVVTEQWAKELQANVDQLRAELESSECRCKDLELEVDIVRASLQGA